MAATRSQPVGAGVRPEHGVHFRVWAPKCRRVEVVLQPENTTIELKPEQGIGNRERK